MELVPAEEPKPVEMTNASVYVWYNRYMKSNKPTVTNNDEIVTISRTEYEELQQQVERLTAQIAAVNSADNVVIPSA